MHDPGPSRIRTRPAAEGTLSRLAYERAKAAGIDLTRLMVKAGVTRQQVEEEDVWLAVRGQIKLVELIADAREEVRRPIRHLFLFIGADPNTDWLSGSGIRLDAKGFVLTGAESTDSRQPLETSRRASFRSVMCDQVRSSASPQQSVRAHKWWRRCMPVWLPSPLNPTRRASHLTGLNLHVFTGHIGLRRSCHHMIGGGVIGDCSWLIQRKLALSVSTMSLSRSVISMRRWRFTVAYSNSSFAAGAKPRPSSTWVISS
jgi:hypothetical protein